MKARDQEREALEARVAALEARVERLAAEGSCAPRVTLADSKGRPRIVAAIEEHEGGARLVVTVVGREPPLLMRSLGQLPEEREAYAAEAGRVTARRAALHPLRSQRAELARRRDFLREDLTYHRDARAAAADLRAGLPEYDRAVETFRAVAERDPWPEGTAALASTVKLREDAAALLARYDRAAAAEEAEWQAARRRRHGRRAP